MRRFGVVVTSSVAIAGVLLVFSFLIIPAAIGVMFADVARHDSSRSAGSPARSPARPALAASFVFDLPTGAAMVCAFGASLARCRACSIRFCAAIAERSARLPSRTVRWGRRRDISRARHCSWRQRRAPTSRSSIWSNTRFLRCARCTLPAPSRRPSWMPANMRSAIACEAERAERTGKAQPHRRRGARRFQRCADLLVPEILWRNAQGRAIRHGRSARAGARARPMGRGSGSAGGALCLRRFLGGGCGRAQ